MLEETATKPKCLTIVKGKTLLDWQLDAYKKLGIQEVSIVKGYKSDMLSNFSRFGFINHNWASTNMVKSLMCASEWLKRYDCIVSYSDLYFESEGILPLYKSRDPLAISYDPNWQSLWEHRFGNPLLDAETFQKTKKEFLKEIGGRASTISSIQGQYMGILKFSPRSWVRIESFLQTLPELVVDRLQMTHLLQMVIDSRISRIRVYAYKGTWFEFDTQSDVKVFNHLML